MSIVRTDTCTKDYLHFLYIARASLTEAHYSSVGQFVGNRGWIRAIGRQWARLFGRASESVTRGDRRERELEVREFVPAAHRPPE